MLLFWFFDHVCPLLDILQFLFYDLCALDQTITFFPKTYYGRKQDACSQRLLERLHSLFLVAQLGKYFSFCLPCFNIKKEPGYKFLQFVFKVITAYFIYLAFQRRGLFYENY